MSSHHSRRRRALVGRPLGSLADAWEAAIGSGSETGGAPASAAPAAPSVGWPSAGPHRRDAWDYAVAEYRAQPGDTVSGLAARYLGDPSRWREIWSLQTGTGSRPERPYVDRYFNKLDPSSTAPGPPWGPGHYFVMPPEAVARAQMFDAAGASVPATGGSPGNVPGGITERPGATSPKRGALMAGGALAALGALGIYAASR